MMPTLLINAKWNATKKLQRMTQIKIPAAISPPLIAPTSANSCRRIQSLVTMQTSRLHRKTQFLPLSTKPGLGTMEKLWPI